MRWREDLERGNLHEKLGDQNKDVEIKRYDGADDIRAAPRTRQMKEVQGRNRYRQNEQGDDADGVGSKNLWNGNRNPVRLVKTVVAKKSAVQSPTAFRKIIRK